MKRSVFTRYSFVLFLAALAAMIAVAAPVQAKAQETTPYAASAATAAAAAPDQPAADPAASAAQAPASGDGYILGTSDRVRVLVFGEPSLSGEFVVDSTGRVALPLVGEVKANGLSLRQFERAVEDLLKVDYLKDPRVSAEVLSFRPFYILGEVNRPGTYPYTAGLTVLNAVVTAGGFTYRANKGSIKIQHQGSDKEISVKLTPNLMLQPGDTITVKERWY
jgi:polysaccharide export outer membrane protein